MKVSQKETGIERGYYTLHTSAHPIIKKRIKETWNGEKVWIRQSHSQGLDIFDFQEIK